jgi:GMP synthase (glutamine-hydrolysing)
MSVTRSSARSARGICAVRRTRERHRRRNPRAPAAVWDAGVPVLGICYGMQTMAAQLGGTVEAGRVREFGYAEVRARGHSALFRDLEDRRNADGHGLLEVWMSHGDKVIDAPAGFAIIASSGACAIAAMADESRRFYGVQFHPEVTHTKQGAAMLARFAHDICGCGYDWNMHDYAGEAIASIRAKVGGDDVLLGLSGGVDSSVAAALLHRAIGDQLTCVFVDHGLLRRDEAEQVLDTFATHLGVRVVHVDAATSLHSRASTIRSSARSSASCSSTGWREATKLSNVRWLAQGTIYRM